MHTSLMSVVCKNGHSAPAKFPNSAFLTGFDVVGRVATVNRKETCPTHMASGPKATLTFDPPTTNSERTRQRKNTVDPASPDFLPLPSFEQCFPRSSKEYRCITYSSFLNFLIVYLGTNSIYMYSIYIVYLLAGFNALVSMPTCIYEYAILDA